jgi:hypothetical protein
VALCEQGVWKGFALIRICGAQIVGVLSKPDCRVALFPDSQPVPRRIIRERRPVACAEGVGETEGNSVLVGPIWRGWAGQLEGPAAGLGYTCDAMVDDNEDSVTDLRVAKDPAVDVPQAVTIRNSKLGVVA